MIKSIYKITNLINNKVYIGQSIHPERRWKEHIWGISNHKSYIHSAIKKYGVENFLFEIIESDIENYNEREIYWINFYQANNPRYGYNLTEGGEDPPLLIGAKNNNYKYSDELVSKIRYDIKYTDTPFKDLAIKYKCPESFINGLNTGKTRKDKNFNYPIRGSQQKANDPDIFFDLMNTTLTIQDIVKKYNSTIYIVYAINEGKRYGQDNITYPIRIRGSRFSLKILKQIKTDLENNIPKTQIAKKYNIGRGVLYRAINNYIGGV